MATADSSRRGESEDMTPEDIAAMKVLNQAYREMTPVGAKPYPSNPKNYNFLARPIPASRACRVCKLPGHQSSDINHANACRDAIISLIDFWWGVKNAISQLYGKRGRFYHVLNASVATYDMRRDETPKVNAKSVEETIVDRLVKNYLKFVSHCMGIKPKMHVVLRKREIEEFEDLCHRLNDLLLDGYSRRRSPC
ncbi:hypothetical protein P154DRAFT_594698 [Amniculicola lignicola CBS 123094]|uniref:Uncharacterized protein n=1 Tax=Amniculicola lignicola CBS 123094 TaxID=1392246 RepID=A0A6A5WMT9_9PLEO|nr:hypothetical protein P154DRAFT_594698 [Amniculicola lignicola CBS 123094]